MFYKKSTLVSRAHHIFSFRREVKEYNPDLKTIRINIFLIYIGL